MAIGNGILEPYVHSNYYNFLGAGSVFNVFSEKYNDGRVYTKTIEELEKIRNDLETKANAFLNGMTPSQLYASLVNKQPMISLAKEILLSPQAKKILQDSSVRYDVNSLQKILSEDLGYAVPQIILQQGYLTESEVVDAIVKMLFDNGVRMTLGKTAKEQRSLISSKFTDANFSKLITEKIIRPFTKQESKRLKQIVLQALQKSKGLKMKGRKLSASTALANYFETEMRRRIVSSDVVYDLENLNSFIRSMKEKISLHFDKEYTTSQAASGAIAEIGMADLIVEASGKEIKIEIIGDKAENKVQQNLNNIISSTNSVIKDDKKQSYSDWLMTRGEQTVRVQVKNYRAAIETFLKIGGSGGAQISILRGGKLMELLQKLQSTSNVLDTFNPEEFGYVLANELWFDLRGSIVHNVNSSQKVEHLFNDKILMEQISSLIINYLGIVWDKSIKVVNPGASNIFYFILGEGFIPTYMIIDGVIKFMRDQEQEIINLKVTPKRIGIKSGLPSKEAFWEEKKEAVGEFLGRSYSDSNLVGVGSRVGSKILSSYEIQSINLKVDAQQLYQSSYVFG